MAETYPPFSGDQSVCAKCGDEGALIEYRECGRCLHTPSEGVFGFEPNERLHRECSRCGYQWDEAIVTQGAGS